MVPRKSAVEQSLETWTDKVLNENLHDTIILSWGVSFDQVADLKPKLAERYITLFAKKTFRGMRFLDVRGNRSTTRGKSVGHAVMLLLRFCVGNYQIACNGSLLWSEREKLRDEFGTTGEKTAKESVRGTHQGSRESWRKRFHKTSQEMRGKQQVFSEEMRTWRIIELNRRQCEDSLRTATIESNAKRPISSPSLSSSQWLDASVKKSGFRTKKTVTFCKH